MAIKRTFGTRTNFMKKAILLIVLLIFPLIFPIVSADLPSFMSAQYLFRNLTTNEALNGTKQIFFAIYNQSNDYQQWNETQNVTLDSGIGSPTLGQITAMDYSFFLFPSYWLISVDGGANMQYNETPVGSAYVSQYSLSTAEHSINTHTGTLDTINVTQGGGTYFTGSTQQTINDQLFTYISGLAYIPSHLGTSDGATTATVTWQSTTNYYIADSAGSGVSDGGWDDGSTHPVTTDGSFNADINQNFYDLRDKSNVSIYINDVQMATMEMDGTTSPTDVTHIIIDNEGENEIGFIYGQLDANIPLSSMGTNGYAKIYINHTNTSSGDYSDSTELYYDNGSQPTIGTTAIAVNNVVIKNVSGIEYYTDSTTYDVTIGSSTNAFVYAYPLNIFNCDYNYQGFGALDVAYAFNNAAISGDSSPPKWDDSITFSKATAFTVTGNAHNNDGRIRCKVEGNPQLDSSWSYTASSNILLNTYGTTSSALLEYFDDENWRLPEGNYDSTGFSTTGQWDSDACLTDGQALLQLGRLDYPHTNWGSGYLPSPNSCDYSSFSANSNYTRTLDDNGNPQTSIRVTLSPLTASDILDAGTVKVYMKLPTQTAWMDVGETYAGADMQTDGDPCQNYVSGSTFGCTFGGKSTANSDYMVVIKIVMEGATTEYVEAISTNW